MVENNNQHIKLSAKFFFLTLGVVVSLITTIATSITLMFAILDRFIPDTLTDAYVSAYNSYVYNDFLTPLAILIIFIPIFFILAYQFRKYLNKSLNKKEAGFLKWVIYIIIFLTSLVIIIDLITLVHYFISGEITLRFIYKVIGVIVVAGLALLYYISLLKDFNQNKLAIFKRFNLRKVLGLISLLLLVFGVVLTFSIMGSPKTQRDYRLDNLKINNLQSLEYSIQNYYDQYKSLPADLTKLDKYSQSSTIDPTTKAVFKYEIVDEVNYKLCANFLKATPERVEVKANPWYHEIGETCFNLEVNKVDNNLKPQA